MSVLEMSSYITAAGLLEADSVFMPVTVRLGKTPAGKVYSGVDPSW